MMSSAEKEAVFETLHKQFLPMVRQLCLGYVKGDRQLAEDLVQDVYVNIWNGLSDFRKQSSYKTWIYRIAVNTCLLHLRDRNPTRPLATLDEIPDGVAGSKQGGEAGYESLYRVIGGLPHLERLIMMMILDELTYEEIGAITGLSAAHLRVKIHRIKKKMRQLIKQD